MSYDGLLGSVIAFIALMAVDTGGGGHVGGDAKTGRDFAGRDNRDERITFNNFLEQHRRSRDDDPETVEDQVEWLRIIVAGSRRLGVEGLQARVRELHTEIIFMRIAGAAVMILLFSLMLAIAILYWPGS